MQMGRWLAIVLSLGGVVWPAAFAAGESLAVQSVDVSPLSRALLIPEAMAILREEGLANGADLAAEMPRAGQGSLWQQALGRVYDPARMVALFDRAFAEALADDPQTVAVSVAFFTAGPGQRALKLELSARQALLDDEIEEAAKDAYLSLAQDNPDRLALIDRFAKANDLIESNVMGALNANLAFLRGMADAGGEALAMSEADMLAQVWGAEATTRADMVDWLFPFLTMAYQPMSDADLTSYIAFSETPAGKRLNAAMFAAFDKMFTSISHDLGLAYGRSLQGDDI